MDRSIVFAGGGLPIREVVDLAVQAEQAGFSSVLTVEAWRSGLVPLAAIASATQTVGIGTYVLNAHLRTPLLAGMSARDLDELSGGRLQLTVGTGNAHMNQVWHGLDTRRPVATMEEYVPLLRRLVGARAGELVEHAGPAYRASWTPVSEPQRPRIPLHLAAMFPRMQAVAGRVADGVAMAALCGPAYLGEVVRPRIRAAAEEVGRDPAEIRILAAPLVMVGEDGAQVRDRMRQSIARLLGPPPHPYYEHVLSEQGEAELVRRVSRLMSEGRVEAAAACVSDEFLDRYVVAGTADHCQRVLEAYRGVLDEAVLTNAAGVDAALGHAGPAGVEALVASYRLMLPLGSSSGSI